LPKNPVQFGNPSKSEFKNPFKSTKNISNKIYFKKSKKKSVRSPPKVV
jgi:hypothetical protein